MLSPSEDMEVILCLSCCTNPATRIQLLMLLSAVKLACDGTTSRVIRCQLCLSIHTGAEGAHADLDRLSQAQSNQGTICK